MIKKLWIILMLFLCMLPISAVTVQAGSYIENDETGIPDKELYKVILASMGKKENEKFTKDDAKNLKVMRVRYYDKVQTFQGIGCLKNVTKLYAFGISDGNLEEIAGELPNLKELTLRGYEEEIQMDEPVPEERRNKIRSLKPLKGMKNLVILNSSYNNLNSLEGVESLKKLKTLKLPDNQLTNLKGMKNLPKLTKLNLSGNNLSNMKEIKNLPELMKLDLSDNNLSHIKKIKNLPKLSILDLSNNNISNIKELKNLPQLTTLNLSNNQLSSVKGIEKLKKLKKLELDNNKLKSIGNIKKLNSLTVLSMCDNKLTGIKGIKNLKKLKDVSFSGNCLNNVNEVINLENLKALRLSRNRIQKLPNFNKIKKLEILSLTENELNEIPDLKMLKNLNVLWLTWNYLTEKEIKKKVPKKFWDFSELELCKWLWEEQKTGIKITYTFPGNKNQITKDTTEIAGKVTPVKIAGYTPQLYLILPDGKVNGWDGMKETIPTVDAGGNFKLENLNLKGCVGQEVEFRFVINYDLAEFTIDRFIVQE